MIALVEYQATHLLEPLADWKNECSDNPNPRVSNSFPVQLLSLLVRIQEFVPTAEPLTYDFFSDIQAQEEASKQDPDKLKGFPTIWFALAFYLKRMDGGNSRECYEFAASFWKSVKSGVYGLQQVALAAKTPLFMSPHKVGSRDIAVITLNGGCKLVTGESIASVSGLRDRKRWNEITKKMLIKNGKTPDEAKRLTDSLSSDVGKILHKPEIPALENAE